MLRTLQQDTFSSTLATDLTYSVLMTRSMFIHEVAIHFVGAYNKTITVYRDDNNGANYDVVLHAQQMANSDDFRFQPDRPIPMIAGDAIKIVVESKSVDVTAYGKISTEAV